MVVPLSEAGEGYLTLQKVDYMYMHNFYFKFSRLVFEQSMKPLHDDIIRGVPLDAPGFIMITGLNFIVGVMLVSSYSSMI